MTHHSVLQVRDHFLKLRAGLAVYYQGAATLDQRTRPRPPEAAYDEVKHALAAKFATKLVHGAPLVVVAMGDSTVAGQVRAVTVL